MSGIVKGVKKVFKAVGNVVKKIIKPVLIATAAYFTAGLALSFIPATASFAASLPGFAGGGVLGTGIGAGATAGTGIFSTVANTIGLGGGLAKGAASAAGASAAAAGATTYAYGTMPVAATGGASAAGAAATGGAVAGAAKVGMSLTDKLLLAKVGTDVAGALFGPSPEDEYAAQYEEAKKWRGAYYGTNADGSGAPPPAPSVTPPQVPGPQQPAGPSTVTPNEQALLAGRETRGLFPTSGERKTPEDPYSMGQMKTNLPTPEGLFSAQPGVRYV